MGAKKELTPQQQKVRTILSWVANVACVLVVVFALVVAIFIIAGSNDDKLTRFGKKIYMNVASDSMEPTFATSDVIIADAFDGTASDLKVGMVVTFKTNINIGGTLYESYNTHRIMKIAGTQVYTRGDNQEGSWKDAIGESTDGSWDPSPVSVSKIVATWGSVDADGNYTSGKMLKGVGGFSNWIQDTANAGQNMKTRFFCVIVLPLILLFVLYAFVLVRTLIIAKLEKERVAKTAPAAGDLSEEEKRRIAEEYMASLNASSETQETQENQEDLADITKEEDNAVETKEE